MELYDHLIPYYDAIFPLRPPVIDFLAQQFEQAGARRILDAACGTGTHALALAERGFEVIGTDLHNGMIEEARRKSQALTNPPRFDVLNMADADAEHLGPWGGL